MTDLTTLVFSVEVTLLDISKQTFALATALQNAAPGDELKDPNKSVVYLFTVSEKMDYLWNECKKLTQAAPIEQADKLMLYLQEAVNEDKSLREQYGIRDKFRFIRDRLHTLFEQAEKEIVEFRKVQDEDVAVLLEDEIIVHVYLYNARGADIDTWRRMVGSSVLYEYSVNRPIYQEKIQIDSLILRKMNRLQHAYLSVAIKKLDVMQESDSTKENPVMKIREGALRVDKIVSFTHNEIEYEVNDEGEFKIKEK